MGARGPARTPTAILQARGSWLADEPERKHEPEFTVGTPERPKFLSPMADQEWNRLVKLLVPSRVLTEADRMALASLCECWADFVNATERLQAATGKQWRLALNAKRACSDALIKAAAQFGLTPAARSRVQAIEGKNADSDKKARFFKAS